jgi:hypothetical protein
MSRFKSKPKQKSGYPGLLEAFEKQRHQVVIKSKFKQQNKSFNSVNSRLMQMFSGKRGK